MKKQTLAAFILFSMVFASCILKEIIELLQILNAEPQKELQVSAGEIKTFQGHSRVTSIGSRAFSDNRLTSVIIPNSVTYIGNNAFQNNLLASVTLPADLSAISQYLFAYNRLASIAIPRNVTSIGAYAFASNYLTSVTIPDSVRSIGKGAFAENRERSYAPDYVVIYGKNLLTAITIGANVTLAGGVEPSFDDGFDNFYNLNGKKAGTYILINGRWNRK